MKNSEHLQVKPKLVLIKRYKLMTTHILFYLKKAKYDKYVQ